MEVKECLQAFSLIDILLIFLTLFKLLIIEQKGNNNIQIDEINFTIIFIEMNINNNNVIDVVKQLNLGFYNFFFFFFFFI
jgi:hypothetical protein